MIIPDEVISKRPGLEALVSNVKKGISGISSGPDEQKELNDLVDIHMNEMLSEYFLKNLPTKDMRTKFLEMHGKEGSTYEDVTKFFNKNLSISPDSLEKGTLTTMENTLSQLQIDLRIVDEVNTETRVPVK